MNKRVLKQFLKMQIDGLSPKKQLAELDDIKEYLFKFRSETEDKIAKKFTYCNTCKEYYPTKSYKLEERDVNYTICVYTDCGYGDDDEFAPAIFHVTEYICPKCGNRKEIKSVRTWRGPSRTRDGRPGCM